MQEAAKISIITPVYNSEKVIEACIRSVANQTYRNLEHLFVDGCSTDGTLDSIRAYAEKHSHIRWVSEKDQGIYDAMNKGIDLSSGAWIYFLGADDLLYSPATLQGVFGEAANANYDVLYGNVLLKISGSLYDGEFNAYKLLHRNICHQALFFRRKIFHQFGKFDLKYRGLADWVLNMQWFNSRKIHHRFIDQVIAIYNNEGYSTRNHDEAFARDKAELIQKYFSFLPLYLFNHQQTRGVKRLTALLYDYRERAITGEELAWPAQPYSLPIPEAELRAKWGLARLDGWFAIGEAWSHLVSHFLPEAPFVVELGCGCGPLARFLKLNPRLRYLGLERSLPAILWCRHAFAAIPDNRFQFECLAESSSGDGVGKSELPVGSQAVDVVVSCTLFTNLLEADCKRYLAQIRRILKPDGCAIISIYDHPSAGKRFETGEGVTKVDDGYFAEIARDAGLSLVKRAGMVYGQTVLIFGISPAAAH
jgi:glycosyltransferase involved in cell wall biosynthesis